MAEEAPISAGEIYAKIHGGPGEPGLSAAHEAARDLANELEDCAHQVFGLAQKIHEGWQGEAADGASNAAIPLAEASVTDAIYLATAGNAVTEQISAFGTVRNSVVPVADSLPEMEALDIVVPGRYESRLAEHEAQARANVQAFATYHQASTANAETVPASYYSLSDTGARIAVAESPAATPGRETVGGTAGTVAPAGSVRAPAPATHVPGSGTAASNTSVRPPGRRPDVPAASAPATETADTPGSPGARPPAGIPTQDGSRQPDDGTHAATYTPQPVNPPTPQPDSYQFGPTGKPINHLNTGTGPWAPPNPYTSTGTGTPGTGTGTGGPGTGARGGYGGTAWRGGTPGFGQAPGQTPGQTPPAPGRGTGAALPGEPVSRGGTAATTGAAGARGAAGMPLGAMGGGRGREEDKDRQPPPYLRNPDPDDTFAGPPQAAAPPVLGERRPGTDAERKER
ncbi:PPE domain-containing protein [Prauserella muralis]|uniref:PPE domain-containing protein n=1 Tax=Prauserella muralis TaxID=588067 RepID=A0A2V4BC21_9PSEU|nr:PPE domain-containing protein [Prauserella muralis]PXY32062.1 hypothetical protein BAY60_07055 [Prauserella muralis]TWE13491.1 PPE family protein [Prauserella muralis]